MEGFRKEQRVALEIDWLSRLFSVDMGIDLGTSVLQVPRAIPMSTLKRRESQSISRATRDRKSVG